MKSVMVVDWGDEQQVLVAVDLGTGEPITLGYVNEHNLQTLQGWFEALVQQRHRARH